MKGTVSSVPEDYVILAPNDEWIDAREVCRLIGFKYPESLYRYMRKHPEFPRSVKLGGHRTRWRRSVITDFIRKLENGEAA